LAAVTPAGKNLLVGVGKGNQTKPNPFFKLQDNGHAVPGRRYPYIGTTLSGALRDRRFRPPNHRNYLVEMQLDFVVQYAPQTFDQAARLMPRLADADNLFQWGSRGDGERFLLDDLAAGI
jgi:hypothetical protein